MRKTLLILGFVLILPAIVHGGQCNWLTSPTAVTFGSYSVFGTSSLVTVSSYAFRCTPQTTATLTFSTGANSNSYFPRYMANGGTTLAYNIYDDAATTIVIGAGSGGSTSRVVFNSTPQDKDFADTIYGKVVQGADIPPGTYTDTVTAFLNWGNGSISASFAVSTVVIPECTISAANVAFGTYDSVVANAIAPLDSASTIQVFCTKNTSGTVSLGNGQWFSGGRRLRSATPDFLNYGLFTNSERSNPWLTTAPNVLSGTSTSKLTPIGGGMVVYGRIPANQDPTLGAYSDTVQATVNY